MAIYDKKITGSNGINYTKEVDGPSDWAGITYNTFFKDLSDGLIYWRNTSGDVIHIYEVSGGGGGGEVNTSSNSGAGQGLALTKVGSDLPFKSITAGTGIILTSSASELQISSSGDIIEVIRGQDSGTSTYFTDLQTALETCKVVNYRYVINIRQDLNLSAPIKIHRDGSASTVGEGFNYADLTINFNGFRVMNISSNAGSVFDIDFGNNSNNTSTLNFINGQIERYNSNSVALLIDRTFGPHVGNFNMDNMYISSELGKSAKLAYYNSGNNVSNFGNSIFKSTSSYALEINYAKIKGFTAICDGTSDTILFATLGNATDFTVINSGSGGGIHASGGWDLSRFNVISNSGIAMACDNTFYGNADIFTLKSITESGLRTYAGSGGIDTKFSNFRIWTGNQSCINSGANDSIFSNFQLYNSSENYATIHESSSFNNQYINGDVINEATTASNGSANCLRLLNCTGVIMKNISFTSLIGTPVYISLLGNSAYSVILSKCFITTKSTTNANQHAFKIVGNSGEIEIKGCDIEVQNAASRCIYGETTAPATFNVRCRNTDFKGGSQATENINLLNVFTDTFGNTYL